MAKVSSTLSKTSLPTHQVGLLQGKAYRVLQQILTKTLFPYDLSIPEWKLLALTTEKAAQRLADLADDLAVEPPLVTALIDTLEKKKLVRRTRDSIDRRAKVIVATPQGAALIREIEPKIRITMRQLLHGVNSEELAIYIKVLQTIIRNGNIVG